MYTYNITLQQKPVFWLGDKFYKVEEVGETTFSTKCPSCNGTREIVYKGYDGKDYTCECPICKKSGFGYGYGDKIEIVNWDIHEYIVYKINAQGPETVSAYKDGTGYIGSMSLTAFCKVGRCMNDYIQTDVSLTGINTDLDISEIDINTTYFNSSRYTFRKKSDAKKLLDVLVERDKKRLKEFNEKFGTDYEYPYQ